MKNKFSNFKNYILIFIVILLFLSIIYVPKIIKSFQNDKDYLKIELKENYGVNEIIPVYVDDKQMSRIYLIDFMNMLIYDIDGSYNMIDKSYSIYNFSDLESYKRYIKGLNIDMNNSVSKYATYERLGYKYYDVYDKDGHRFIFKTNGVLQYTVLFGDIEEE